MELPGALRGDRVPGNANEDERCEGSRSRQLAHGCLRRERDIRAEGGAGDGLGQAPDAFDSANSNLAERFRLAGIVSPLR